MCDRKSFTGDFDFFLHPGESSPTSSADGMRGGHGIKRGDLIGTHGYVGRNQRGEVRGVLVIRSNRFILDSFLCTVVVQLCCFGTGLTLLAPCVRLLPKVRVPTLHHRMNALQQLVHTWPGTVSGGLVKKPLGCCAVAFCAAARQELEATGSSRGRETRLASHGCCYC
jgi:hypothetical protein